MEEEVLSENVTLVQLVITLIKPDNSRQNSFIKSHTNIQAIVLPVIVVSTINN